MGVKERVGRQLAPRVTRLAPGLTAGFVREALDRAIHGVSPNHVRYAGAQGFVTNLGGLVTAALTIPANISGMALIQCRMVAGIAHLRGYDLEDPRVRNAILTCLLGEETINSLVKKH